MIKDASSPPAVHAGMVRTPKNNETASSSSKNNENSNIYSAPPASLSCTGLVMSQSFLDDPECVRLRKKLESNTKFEDVDDEMLQKVLCHLNEYEATCASQADYTEAKKSRGFAEIVRREIYIRSAKKIGRSSSSSSPSSSTPNGSSLNNANAQNTNINHTNANSNANYSKVNNAIRASYENKFNQALAEFDKETTEKRDYIVKRHQQSIGRLEKSWTDEMPRHYRKPSHRLLQLKQIERTLAMAGDYDQASQIHSEVDALAVVEQQQQQQKLIVDYRAARAKLLEKHQRELEAFDSTRSDGRRVIEARHQTELTAAVNRNIVMQQKRREATRIQNYRSSPQRKFTVSKANIWKNQQQENTLLPPLLPPNDPQILEEEDKKKREAFKLREDVKKRREEEEKRRSELIEKTNQDYQKEKNSNKNSNNQQKGPKQPTFVTDNETMNLNKPNFQSTSAENEKANYSSDDNGNDTNDGLSDSAGKSDGLSGTSGLLEHNINSNIDNLLNGNKKDDNENQESHNKENICNTENSEKIDGIAGDGQRETNETIDQPTENDLKEEEPSAEETKKENSPKTVEEAGTVLKEEQNTTVDDQNNDDDKDDSNNVNAENNEPKEEQEEVKEEQKEVKKELTEVNDEPKEENNEPKEENNEPKEENNEPKEENNEQKEVNKEELADKENDDKSGRVCSTEHDSQKLQKVQSQRANNGDNSTQISLPLLPEPPVVQSHSTPNIANVSSSNSVSAGMANSSASSTSAAMASSAHTDSGGKGSCSGTVLSSVSMSSQSSVSDYEVDKDLVGVDADTGYTLVVPFNSARLKESQEKSVLSQTPSEVDFSKIHAEDIVAQPLTPE